MAVVKLFRRPNASAATDKQQDRFTFKRIEKQGQQPQRDFYILREEWDSFVNDLLKFNPDGTTEIPLVTHD